MPLGSTYRVDGYRELSRALGRGPKVLKQEWLRRRRELAKPTAELAESRALTRIRNMPQSRAWAQMRVGVTQNYVYVAPKKGGVKAGRRKRRKLAPLMMDRAMAPALEAQEDQILRDFDKILVELGRDFER